MRALHFFGPIRISRLNNWKTLIFTFGKLLVALSELKGTLSRSALSNAMQILHILPLGRVCKLVRRLPHWS